ncbi:GGDEF domain-containing protein [Marinobacter vulgaris]|uniref:diguanylate cyclase n=1 Tax=Marinobacter vulgaris TaxID=1928331 RepID=A0A2V3ZQE9_9GAMM|nr:GGDEF domain-containing protein [Marinobacter vulgaris]PXX92437.1 GGDEF domain-containing protein [Marinobacter vulgaris]TSJ71621.1 GGDEF domain-containing protein [Marinobacter vulgaris]
MQMLPLLKVGSLTFLITILSFCLSQAAFAAVDIDEGWEYRWGDSPFSEDDVPQWTRADDPEQWQAIGFPSNPPDREGRDQIWYRVTLPDGQWQEPVLYIFSVDLIVQVWLDGENIYQYGTFDDQGRGRFEGWPWHAVPLPEDFGGKQVYFRIFSDYTDIGLWGEVSIMNRPDLTLFILENSLEALVIAGFSALIALLSLIFALLQNEKKSFGSIALFSLSSAVLLLSESQASQLLWDAPLVWDYLAAGSYYLLPVAMALLLEQWFSNHHPWLINLVWKIHLVYAVGAIGLALTGVVDLSSTFPPFDALLLVSLVTIAMVVIRRFRQLLIEQQVILGAYGIFCSLLVADMAVAHGFLPWWRVPVSWGTLVFSLAVVLISLWHYARTQQALHQLNLSLEQQVGERTEKAEALARLEQARVRLLTFENEKTRVLNDIIAELQDCITLNQTFSVLARRLPDLCSPLKGKLYQRVDDGRAFALLTRWGYAGEPEAPARIETPDGPPPQNLIPTLHSAGGGESGQWDGGIDNSLCLWISIQSASEGQIVMAVLFVEVPEEFARESTDYGAARLFQALSQGVQKIGIALSNIGLREELHKYSYEDGLTGLKNRRYFDQLLEHESAVALRSDQPLSLLIVDIDHFKQFNDSHGHEAGDSALKAVAGMLARHFRDSDVVCRFGGEEFVIIMAGSSANAAYDKAMELARAIRSMPIEHGATNLGRVTISVGVASWPECSESPENLLGLADRALYRAKEAGRDRVEIA